MSSTNPFGQPSNAESESGYRAPQSDLYSGVLSRLLAGPLGVGGLGWALDRWLGTSFLLPCGILLGMALALYVIWLRYGRT